MSRGLQDQEDSAQWDQAVQEKAAKEQALEAALTGTTADGTGAAAGLLSCPALNTAESWLPSTHASSLASRTYWWLRNLIRSLQPP